MKPTEPNQPQTDAEDELEDVAEIIDGELMVSPRPDADLVVVAARLRKLLDGTEGWWIRGAVDLHLQRDLLVPDVAGWRRERLVTVPNVAFTVAPDWVCEILSPSTEACDRVRKLPIYARAGVRVAWLINPALKTLEVFGLEGSRWVLLGAYAGDESVRASPFDALEWGLSTLWAP